MCWTVGISIQCLWPCYLLLQANEKSSQQNEAVKNHQTANDCFYITEPCLCRKENDYVTKVTRHFNFFEQSAQACTSQLEIITYSSTLSPYNSYCCLPSCLWTRNWSSSPGCWMYWNRVLSSELQSLGCLLFTFPRCWSYLLSM